MDTMQRYQLDFNKNQQQLREMTIWVILLRDPWILLFLT